MIPGLHVILTVVWHSSTILPAWKKGLVVSMWKVLINWLLMWIHSHHLKHQTHEQSGFTPVNSTTDQYYQFEYCWSANVMFAVYVDIKKAFDSVHRKALWDLQCLSGIPARIIGLLTVLRDCECYEVFPVSFL